MLFTHEDEGEGVIGDASRPHPCLQGFLFSCKAGFVIIISYYRVSDDKLQPTPRFSLQATTV